MKAGHDEPFAPGRFCCGTAAFFGGGDACVAPTFGAQSAAVVAHRKWFLAL